MTRSVRTPVSVVRVDGQVVPHVSVSAPTGTSTDLTGNTAGGGLAGAEASVEWELWEPVTDHVETRHSPAVRYPPGAPVTVDMGTEEDGLHRVFTGHLDSTPESLGDAGRTSRAVSIFDPPEGLTFRVRALAAVMHPYISGTTGNDELRAFGLSSRYPVEQAFNALGVWSCPPILSGRTVWHQAMAGTTFPAIGTVYRARCYTSDNGALGGAHVKPRDWTFPDGRPSMIRPLVTGVTQEYNGTGHAISLLADLNPGNTLANWTVRIQHPDTGNNASIGIAYAGSQIRVFRTNSDGSDVLLRTLIPTVATTRVLLHYYDNVLTVVTSDPATAVTTHPFSVAWPNASGRTGVLINAPAGQVGAVVIDRGLTLSQATARVRAPHTLRYSTRMDAPYRAMNALPRIESEDPVAWLVATAHADQQVILVESDGSVTYSDPMAWSALPHTWEITDATPTDTNVSLDDASWVHERRAPFSRIRVEGEQETVRAATGHRPNLLFARPDEEITLTKGDDPVTIPMEPFHPNSDWITAPDTTLRYAGEPATEPWHRPDDFARGRGTWVGGHVRQANGTIYWARPSDVTFELINTGDGWAFIATPGPTLGDNDTFISLPHPQSPLLNDEPQLRSRPLPRLAGHVQAFRSDAAGYGPYVDDPDLPERVHDAGIFAQGDITALAEGLHDRIVNQVGPMTITCAWFPAQLGTRGRIRSTTRADLEWDAVITGIPTRSCAPGDLQMQLEVWVLDVVQHSVSWGEMQRARYRAEGSETWEDVQADNPPTWAAWQTAETNRSADTR